MNPHKGAARRIVDAITDKIEASNGRYAITIAGESGCGKTETGKALVEELEHRGIRAMVLGQDNYFFLAPQPNDAKRKSDPAWLGPRKEVDLGWMDDNLREAKMGVDSINVPHIEYDTNTRTIFSLDIKETKVIIAEGTYTSLLRHVDTRIFVDADYHDTLPYRKKRNRGNEVNDPFVEGILETEHKIIAGHIFLADFVITKDCEVIPAE